MKSIDILCAPRASTATCSSIDEYRILRHGKRRRHIINHHAQRLTQVLKGTAPPFSCSSSSSSQLPFDPSCKPYYQKGPNISSKEMQSRRKSSADASDLNTTSSTYLLSDDDKKPFLHKLIMADNEHDSTSLIPLKPATDIQSKKKELPVFRTSSTTSFDQVVELRVSIHCKGCEGKVRKHLSRMEGVTSFSIDFSTKKVTVIGDVSPVGVLTSISKVKKAEFWASPSSGKIFPSRREEII